MRREQLVDLLVLPARLMRRAIDSRECDHAGEFCFAAQGCWACDLGPECLMLKDFEACVYRSSEARLQELGRVAREFMEERIQAVGHDAAACSCEMCTWMREAQRLFDAEGKDSCR